MAVDDIGAEVQLLQQVHNPSAEETEPAAVVRVIAGRGTVQLGPLKIFFPVDQVDRDIVKRCLAEHALFHDAADECLHPLPCLFDGEAAVIHALVERHYDTHIVPLFLQGLGQRTDNIGQAAGLGKG